MRKTILIVLLAIAFSLAAGTAAEARPNSSATTSDRIETRASAAEHRHSSGVGFALGISSITPIPSGSAFATSTGGSITGILQLTGNDAIQFLLAIPATTPGFSFGIGSIYKRTLVGGEGGGLHVGGGFALGTYGSGTIGGTTSTDFAMSIPVLVGVHFNVTGTDIAFHFDGGGTFGLLALGKTITNFSMGQYSSVMGGSVVYYF